MSRRVTKRWIGMCAAVAAVGSTATHAAGKACGALTKLKLPQATVTTAVVVAKGTLQLPATGARGGAPNTTALPEFCRVQATLKPSVDSDIKMEVWLPTGGWNGDYHTVGNSGWGGAIAYQSLMDSLQRGYVTASTDTGHTEAGATWAPGHPEKWKDYTNRSIHETTVKAKAITAAFYGKAATNSFMTGCSLGGLQTVKAIQEHPEDFNAVVAGSPHINMTRWNAAQMWPAWLLTKDPDKFISKAKLANMHKAVLERCDGSDGLKDGIVDSPLACDFKPAQMLCQGADSDQCLTPKQVEFAQQLYDGPVMQSTGASINPGSLLGIESTWNFTVPPNNPAIASDLYKYLVHEDPSWDWRSMDYQQDILLAEKKIAPIINADNPNLAPYFKRGGKLLMYLGSYEGTNFTAHLGYLDKVRMVAGAKAVDAAVRTFIVPGMGHCGGGIGAETFDKLGAIVAWQKTGKAPEVLDASQVRDGKTNFTRPLCAYPKTARYNGSGDSTRADNFSCK